MQDFIKKMRSLNAEIQGGSKKFEEQLRQAAEQVKQDPLDFFDLFGKTNQDKK